MKDTDRDKDASETVIEGKATVRSGRKKMSDKNFGRKKTYAGHKQTDSGNAGDFNSDTTSDYKNRLIKNRFYQLGKLFSPKNVSWFLVILFALFAGWFWISGKHMFFFTRDSQQLTSILNEAREWSLDSQRLLVNLQKQLVILETEIAILKEQQAKQIQDERLGEISSELSVLKSMFEKLNKKMAATLSVNVKATMTKWLEIEKINYFLDILWIDSQTGRDLTRHLQLIEDFKTIYINDNTLKDYLNSVDTALRGNLSSHSSLLVELNGFLVENLNQPKKSKNLLFLNDGKEERNEDIVNTTKSNDLTWKEYFAGLVKLRKISEENSLTGLSQPQNGDLNQKTEQNIAKQLISQESYIIETVSQAISYLTALLDKGETVLSSEQITVLNLHLTQLQSRQGVDQMINDIYHNQRTKPAREDK